jgi:signal transduction histidine kinase/tetratricopeptide (TPR) repeat protein
MRKIIASTILIFFNLIASQTQAQSKLDSLYKVASQYEKNDSNKVLLLANLSVYSEAKSLSKSRDLLQQSQALNEKINSKRAQQRIQSAQLILDFIEQVFPSLETEQKNKLASSTKNNSNITSFGKSSIKLSDYPKALDYLQQELNIHDSLKNKSAVAKTQNAIGLVFMRLSDLSKALDYFQKALLINEAEDDKLSIANTYMNIGNVFFSLEQLDKAIEYYNKALVINKSLGFKQKIASNYFAIARVLVKQKLYSNAINQYYKTLEIVTSDDALKAKTYAELGNAYAANNDDINALSFYIQSYHLNQKIDNEISEPIQNKAAILSKMSEAQFYHQRAEYILNVLDTKSDIALNLQQIGMVLSNIEDEEKAFTCLQLSRSLASQLGTISIESEALSKMSYLYEKLGKYNLAFNSFKTYILLRDSISSSEKQKEITRREMQFEFNQKESEYKLLQQITDEKLKQQSLQARQQEALLQLRKSELDRTNKQKELERLQYLKTQAELSAEKSQNQTRTNELENALKEKKLLGDKQRQQEELAEQKISTQKAIRNSFVIGAALLLILLLVLVNRFRLKQKSERRLNKAYEDLQVTQQQLIQQEKLASLGELTAGIAHEIKNPLNFVNNFAQLSAELIDELDSIEDVEERKEILSDIKKNLGKIHHHGQRADSIVQNMLQHSRGNSGEKVATDLNKLCDEYADLSFHGMRATSSSFQCSIIKNFDKELPKVNLIQQDISRVVLNILNNAFYAVNKRSQEESNSDWKATVNIQTSMQQVSNKRYVCLKIRDNGTGMPEHVKQKIFEPFFTTKPTGEGTGLGLSLSYDIITKEHQGKLEVNSEANEYTEFVIWLPV